MGEIPPNKACHEIRPPRLGIADLWESASWGLVNLGEGGWRGWQHPRSTSGEFSRRWKYCLSLGWGMKALGGWLGL